MKTATLLPAIASFAALVSCQSRLPIRNRTLVEPYKGLRIPTEKPLKFVIILEKYTVSDLQRDAMTTNDDEPLNSFAQEFDSCSLASDAYCMAKVGNLQQPCCKGRTFPIKATYEPNEQHYWTLIQDFMIAPNDTVVVKFPRKPISFRIYSDSGVLVKIIAPDFANYHPECVNCDMVLDSMCQVLCYPETETYAVIWPSGLSRAKSPSRVNIYAPMTARDMKRYSEGNSSAFDSLYLKQAVAQLPSSAFSSAPNATGNGAPVSTPSAGTTPGKGSPSVSGAKTLQTEFLAIILLFLLVVI